RGQGLPGSGGGPAGDLLLVVHVDLHPLFRRDGDTLEVRVPVSLAEAIDGGKVDLPTPWGTISLKIPPMTSGGRKLRAVGMGVRHANGTAGDMIAEVQIVLPPALDPDLAARLRSESSGFDPRPGLRW
ncbi:MAG: DnaJ C-terminal domain-containing protein, partial [Planctomycetaceae bacterium]